MLDPQMMTSMAVPGMLSPDGKCHSFDHRANGYARGEGFGVLLIKRLDDAIRDGDTIRSIVRATGSNQDGRTPIVTQPNAYAQEKLIRDTYRSADLDLRSTGYFEAHGTGTAAGDPKEAKSIAAVFRDHRSADDPLYIGAVKTNIGHLEGASGIASLIKTILVLEKGIIPPNLWFEKVNPDILEEEWNIKVLVMHSTYGRSMLIGASFLHGVLLGQETDFAERQSIHSALEARMFTLYLKMLIIT